MWKAGTVKRVLCCFILVLSGAATHAQEPKPLWVIGYRGVTEGRAPYTATHAASELAKYMSKVLGVKVKTVPWEKADAKNLFLVTDANHAPKDVAAELDGKALDGFVIKYPYTLDGKRVCLLVSHDNRGNDFPVYYFLTKFMDVHWVGPGEIGEVVPSNPAWKMPRKISVLEEPDISAMRFWNTPGFMCRQWLAGSSHMHFNHALGGIFHPNKYKDQPEVYPLVEGKRYIPPLSSIYSGWQPCTGNPKVVDIAVEHVLTMLKQAPHLMCISLGVNDGGGNYCTCPLCRAQDAKDAFDNPSERPLLSDRFFWFYNTVMAKVAQKNPNARVAILGYGAITGVPPHETKIDPRIIVCKTGQVGRIINDRWREAGARVFASWKYAFQGGFLVSRQYPHMLADEARLLKSVGGIGLYMSPDGAWAEAAPYMYVLAHVLWDTERDVDELLDEYNQLAFGEHAGPIMRKYFALWEEVYERGPASRRSDTMQGWRRPEQFTNFRREDLDALNVLLAEAKAAAMTERQGARFNYFATYHEWLRLNLEQALFVRELNDRRWVAARREGDVLDVMAAHAGLSERINTMWHETIVKDRSCWLIVQRFHKSKPADYWNYYLRTLRTGLASAQETAADDVMEIMTLRKMRSDGKQKTQAFWKETLQRYPQLESFIGPQLKALDKDTPRNLVLNGGFEEGKDGNPPTLPGWLPYQVFGGNKGVPPSYSWKDGSGRDGGKAVGIHEGLYEEWRTEPMRLEGGRYRYTYWVKTINREYTTAFWFIRYEKKGTDVDIMAFNEPPTHGEWRKVSRTFTIDKAGEYMIQLGSSWQNKGCETYFDDVELRKIW